MQNEIEELLKNVANKVAAIGEAKRMYASKLAPDFNIFDYLRDDEVGLSRCIASLLIPNGTHGQGNLFLKNFLERIDKVLFDNELVKRWTDTVIDGCHASLEEQANGLRRIDVYLRFNNGEIIGIENKPWARDQENQLADYAKFIQGQANGKKWLIIYLSNNDPSNSEYSISKPHREELEKSGNFIWLNYAVLVEWLEFCAQNSKALNVRIFIEELAKFVSTKINGELDMSEEQEIKNILKSGENIRSAFHIIKALESLKEDLLVKLRADLESRFNLKGWELEWDKDLSCNWKNYVGFNVKFYKNQNFYLRFRFSSPDLGSLIWGIRQDDQKERNPQNNIEINSLMNNQFGNGKQWDWFAWHSYIHKNNNIFKEDDLHWDKNEQPWLSIINGGMADKITELAISVWKTFESSKNLLIDGDVTQFIDQSSSLET